MRCPDANLIPSLAGNNQVHSDLDAISRLVFSSVDGQMSIREISYQCGLDEALTCRIVLRLIDRGVIQLPGYKNVSDEASHPTDTGTGHTPTEGASAVTSILPETGTLYDLLGVDPDVSRQDLRTKYFELSKKYHPDRVFDKTNPDLRQKMERVFRRMTDAYNTLSNPRSREAYDATIADEIALKAIEKQLKTAISQPASPAWQDAQPQDTDSGRASQPSSRPSSKVQTSSSQKSPTPPPPTSRPSIPEHDARRLQWKRERAGRAMAAILNRNSISPPVMAQAKARLADAEFALEQERYANAVQLLSEVLAIDPKHEQAQQLIEKARAGYAVTIAKENVTKGLHLQRQGKLGDAARHFEQAMQADAKNLDARHLLASVLLEQRRELPRAQALMKEVIGLGGERARYFATIGDIYLLAKDLDRAARAFERAVFLAPDNKEYKKRIRACKK
ncbi:MAG: DnaJ domain-containing protein [Myxococcota bacterium]|nr:DnaJ domain-containing protein [Myxococcota bacterium]